jgi:hypothetical protein
MTFKNVRWEAIQDDQRKELIDYYKWVINLATFVLTVSLTLTALFSDGLRTTRLLIVGWILLGLCILFDWVLVKRLTTLPIVLSVPDNQRTWLHRSFLKSLPNLRIYGLVQNLLFLIGVLVIGIGFALNLRS